MAVFTARGKRIWAIRFAAIRLYLSFAFVIVIAGITIGAFVATFMVRHGITVDFVSPIIIH